MLLSRKVLAILLKFCEILQNNYLASFFSKSCRIQPSLVIQLAFPLRWHFCRTSWKAANWTAAAEAVWMITWRTTTSSLPSGASACLSTELASCAAGLKTFPIDATSSHEVHAIFLRVLLEVPMSRVGFCYLRFQWAQICSNEVFDEADQLLDQGFRSNNFVGWFISKGDRNSAFGTHEQTDLVELWRIVCTTPGLDFFVCC